MEDKELNSKLKKEIKKIKEQVATEGIQNNNIEFLYKVIDVEKDLCEIEEKGGESMNYNEYGRYNEGGYGREQYGREQYGIQGNFSGEGYGRRGRYRGNNYMERMYNEYGRYEEGREQYNRGGNYNAKEDSMKSLEYMLESMVDFVKMLHQEASSQEEVGLIKKYIKKLSEM